MVDISEDGEWLRWGCVGDGGLYTGCNWERTSIRLVENTIYYDGDTSKRSYDDFVDAVRKHPHPITTLVITSMGGPTTGGKLFGLWVHENQVDVQVRDICFSSCANYIFPAGASKYIEKDAFVAWHGNPIGMYGEDDDADANLRQVAEDIFRPRMIEDGIQDIEQALADSIQAHKEEVQLERAFYDMIGVDPEIAYHFHVVEGGDTDPGQAPMQVLGFTYSLANMERFGMQNVFYLGSGRYPATQERSNGNIILEMQVDPAYTYTKR